MVTGGGAGIDVMAVGQTFERGGGRAEGRARMGEPGKRERSRIL